MLCDAGVIEAPLRDRHKAMVGFRNIAVHDYRKLNLELVRNIIQQRLEDFRQFGRVLLQIIEMYKLSLLRRNLMNY